MMPRRFLPSLVLLFLAIALASFMSLGSQASASPKSFAVASSVSDGATLSGSFEWNASTSHESVDRIDFVVDGTVKWTEFHAPYQYNGDPHGVLDTTTLSNGSHTLGLQARSSSGSVATASSRVTIANSSTTSAPVLSGTIAAPGGLAEVGQTIVASAGSWSGTAPITYAYAWQRCDSTGGACAPIGASGSSYTVAAADAGSTLRVRVSASNSAGSASALSYATAVIKQPTTTFTATSSIAGGATLAGSLTWTATATATGASISRIDFYIDGALRWTESATPYQYNGDPNGVLDTTTLANGSHRLAVTAYSTDGRTSTASSGVTISNSVAPAPISNPALGSVPKYGFSPGYKTLTRNATDRAFELDQMKTAANGHPAVVRVDSTPGNQGLLDAWVPDVHARNLEPMLVLFGTTGPVDPGTAAAFASAQAKKWKGTVRLYEFCNEPDLHGWTPEGYTASLKAVYSAIKAADPNAIVIAGALWKWDSGTTANPTGGAREWVRRMYAAGAHGSFDMLSLHLYDDPDDHGSWNLWDQAFTMSTSVRSIMDSNGDQTIPIISTESGGRVPGYTEAQQATIVSHGFEHLASGQIGMYLVYSMMDDDVVGFGLLRPDRTRRPSWLAYQSRAS